MKTCYRLNKIQIHWPTMSHFIAVVCKVFIFYFLVLKVVFSSYIFTGILEQKNNDIKISTKLIRNDLSFRKFI